MTDVNGNKHSAKQYLKVFDFGMNEQINKKLFPKNYEYPTSVQFELTYKCNHKCIHCYNRSSKDNRSKKEISEDK